MQRPTGVYSAQPTAAQLRPHTWPAYRLARQHAAPLGSRCGTGRSPLTRQQSGHGHRDHIPTLSTLLAGPHGPTVVCAVLGRVAAPGDGLSSDRPRGCVPPRISARPARPVCAAVGGLGGNRTVYIAAFRRKNSSACAAIVAALPWPCPHHMPCAYCHGTLLHPLPHSHRPLFFSADKNFRQKQQACLVAYAW